MPERLRRTLYIQCNPLLDLYADVDEAFLARYHLPENASLVYSPCYYGLFDELQERHDVVRNPGGSGLHTACVARWLLRAACSEHTVAYVGCVGDDADGRMLRHAAEGHGVEMHLEVTARARTGRCAVLRRDGARTLVADLAAAGCLGLDHVEGAAVRAAMAEAAVVYTTAYATPFHVPHTTRLAAAARVAGSSRRFALGLSAKEVLEDFGEELVDFLEKIDLVFGNRDEMRDLAMMLQWVPQEMTDMELVRKLAQEMMYDHHSTRQVVMTRGAEPVLYATSAGLAGEVAVVRLTREAGKRRATGAGDAFVGGFLAAMTRTDDIAACCRLGARCASYVIDHGIASLPLGDAPSLTLPDGAEQKSEG